MGRWQKLDILLEKKWLKNWYYQKMSITKNMQLNWYSSNEENWERFQWFLKIKLKTLFDTSPSHHFSKFKNFLRVCWFLGKILSNFEPPLENSTTCTTITDTPNSRFAEKSSVVRQLHNKNEVLSFTGANSNYNICYCIRVILHSTYLLKSV